MFQASDIGKQFYMLQVLDNLAHVTGLIQSNSRFSNFLIVLLF